MPDIIDTPSQHFLRANSDAYEWLVARAQAIDWRTDAEAALRQVTDAAIFASVFHPGRFADGALDNIAYEVGRRLPTENGRAASTPLSTRRTRRVLHVTPLITLGGHSPLIQHWIVEDRHSAHSIVLVNQRGDIPSDWLHAIRSAGAGLHVLPDEPLVDKARRLRRIAIQTADVVVWHVIDPDVVPIVAFAVPESPPVALVDLCDHQFWLGSSVADLLVNLRSVGSVETAERRFIANNYVLPIALAEAASPPSRAAARQALGIDAGQTVLLSVGRGLKFRPCGPYDFIATLGTLLQREPSAHAYVVGESEIGIAPYLRSPAHERIHFVGAVDAAAAATYRAAADVYLESFPYGSQTALLEAALSGLPVVPAYAPLAPTLVANDESIADLAANPGDEEEYVRRARHYIHDRDSRRTHGALLRQRVRNGHVGDAWLSSLAGLYARMDAVSHRPSPIPVAPCIFSRSDVGLSLWSGTPDARSSYGHWSTHSDAAALRHASYVAKYAGNYRAARRLACRSLVHAPRERAAWRLLAASLVGKLGPAVRDYLPGR